MKKVVLFLTVLHFLPAYSMNILGYDPDSGDGVLYVPFSPDPAFADAESESGETPRMPEGSECGYESGEASPNSQQNDDWWYVDDYADKEKDANDADDERGSEDEKEVSSQVFSQTLIAIGGQVKPMFQHIEDAKAGNNNFANTFLLIEDGADVFEKGRVGSLRLSSKKFMTIKRGEYSYDPTYSHGVGAIKIKQRDLR